jgi:hypothetical protein
MTKEQLWKVYCDKNPSFAGSGNVTMSARGLRKLFDTTWDTAMYDGVEDSYKDSSHSRSASVDELMSIFGMK